MTTKPQPRNQARPPVTERWGRVVGVLLLLLGLVGTLYLLPQTPAGRGWLLSRVQGALSNSGYTLKYLESAGNPWRGVTLRGATLTGPGVDASLGRLEVSYTLPALLRGKLPLSIDAKMLRGEVSPSEFPERAGGEGLPIEPVLRALTLNDAALTVDGTAYALPGLSLSDFSVEQKGNAYILAGAVATPDGSADLGGTLRLSPFALQADITRADLSLARAWWPGAQGGTLSGRVTVQGGEVTGRFELENATTALAGISLTEVSGPVELDYPFINADLTGRALGGPVAAEGNVDISKKLWQADVTGRAELGAAASWLARGRLDEEQLDAVPLTGTANVSLDASGWREVTLTGTATGAGTVAGRALDGLNAAFGFQTGVGTSVTAAAEVAGAPVAVTLRPAGEGLELQARASKVPLIESLTANLDVDVTSSSDGLSGGGTLGVAGEAWGRTLSAKVDGALDNTPDGAALSLTIQGESSLGETLSGAFTLENGAVQGDLTAQGLTAPVLNEPFTLRLLADGPLEALPLALELDAAEPLELAAGGNGLATDLRGRAEGTLRGSNLTLQGDFGGLGLDGTLDVSSRSGSLGYTLSDTALRGPVTGTVSIEEGTLTLDGGTVRTQAQLLSSPLDAGALGLPALDAGVTVSNGESGGLTATLQDAAKGLSSELQGGKVAATFGDTPVTLGGEAATLDGRASFDIGAPLESLNTSLSVTGALGAARLEGSAAGTRLELRAEPGFALGPLTLAQAADLSGTLDLTTRQANVAGRVGALDVNLAGSADTRGGAATLTLQTTGQSAGEALRVDATLEDGVVSAWSVTGGVPLDPIGAALGLPLSGALTSDLSLEDGRYEGTATLDGGVFGRAVGATLQGTGDELLVEAQTPAAGQTVRLSGSLLPELSAALELPALDVGIMLQGPPDALTAAGEGVLPGLSLAGVSLEPQPWAFNGSMQDQRATLTVGESALEARWGAGGWALDGRISQGVTLPGGRAHLVADIRPGDAVGESVTEGGLSKSSVTGSLVLETPDASVTLPIAGTLENLALEGRVPASLAAEAFGLGVPLEGDLTLDAHVTPFAASRFDATAVWETSTPLTVNVRDGGGLRVTAAAEGFTAGFENGRLDVTADAFSLGTFSPALAGAALSGDLEGSLVDAAGWDGLLTLTTRDPAAALTLRGAGEQLLLEGEATGNAWSAGANGSLSPNPQLELTAKAADVASFTGNLTGTNLTGRVVVDAPDAPSLGLSVPEETVDVQASFGDGLTLALRGDALVADLQNGVWAGRLELPFSLEGETHWVTGTLSGARWEAALEGAVSGPFVAGPLELSRAGVTSTLALEPTPWLPDALSGSLDGSSLTVTLSATPDARWEAVVEAGAEATARSQTLPLDLQAEFSGEGARYAGGGTLEFEDQILPFTLQGQGGALSGKVTLEDVALEPFSALLPLSLTGAANGSVAFGTGDGLTYDADVNLAGRAQAQPFDVTLRATPQHVDVTGEAAGVSLSVNGTPTSGFAFELEDAARALELTGRLELGDGLALEGAGQALGQPATLSASYSPGDARFEASVAGATLSGSLQGTRFEAQARVPEGMLPAAAQAEAIQAEVTGEVSGGVTITNLEVHSTLLNEPLALDVAGTAWPDTNLTGILDLGLKPEPARVSIIKSGNLYKAFVKQGALLASAYLESGTLSQLGLEGETILPLSQLGVDTSTQTSLAVTSDLAWTPEEGYQGGAELGLEPSSEGSARAQLTLSGNGGLTVTGEGSVQGSVLKLDATLGPSLQNPALGGSAHLETPLSALAPVWPGEALALTSDVTLAGSARAPTVAGTVRLEGALEAAGTLQGSLEGVNVNLAGPGLNLTASGDAGGWTLTTEARSLDVGPLFPPVSVPLFSGTFEASQAWGEPLRASLTGLEFWTLRSEVSGALHYDEGITGTLAGHLDVADWRGAPLRGVVRGEVALGRAGEAEKNLAGTVTLENLGLQSAPWGLSGTATLAGSAADPELDVRLSGIGNASGTFSATAAPRSGRVSLRSDLAVADFSSDATVTISPGDHNASGTLAWGDYGLTLRGDTSAVDFLGTGALAGWAAELDPARGALSLGGTLESFGALAGRVALSLDAKGDAWLTGALTDVRVGNIPVGTVALRGAGSKVAVDGEAIAGTVALTGSPQWTLQRLELPLPVGLRLEASGSGGLGRGALTGALSGALAGAEVAVGLSGSYGDGALFVTADGGLLSGEVSLDARFGEGWSGGLELTGAHFGDMTADVQGELSGEKIAPQLSGQVEALGNGILNESRLSGTFSASSQNITLEQTLTSPRLGAPLTLSGEVWPAPALVLENGGERLELNVNPDGTLTSRGSLTLEAAGFGLRLGALEGSGGLEGVLETPLPGFTLETDVASVTEVLARQTLRLEGQEDADGALVIGWDDGFTLTVKGLGYETQVGTLSLAGTLAGLNGTLQGRWAGTGGNLLPWLAEADVPFGVAVGDAQVTLSSQSSLGRLTASLDRERLAFDIDAALATGAGAANVRLAYTPQAGPQGTVTLDAVPLLGGDAPLSLETNLTLDAGGVAGDARLLAGGGTVRAAGTLGWTRLVPEGLRARSLPLAENTLRGTLRAANVDLAALPGVGLPNVYAPLSGTAEFGGDNVAGQLLIPEGRVLDTPLPTELEFNGTLANVDVRGSLAESRVDLAWNGRTLSGLVNLENFPLQTLAEAVVSDTGVQASLTGVARLELPVATPAQGTLEVATERVRLERDGVVSEGNASFRFEAGGLVVDEVRFSGAGEWRAQGRVTREALTGSVEAENADFGPLLGLVPRLAELEVGAQGSFTLRAGGSLRNPDITFSAPELALKAGGAAGRLDGTEGRLTGETLSLTSTLTGTSPVTGSLAVEGGGTLSLLPFATAGLRFGFGGAATLPVVGALEALRGEVASSSAGWTLDATGTLGEPFRVSGTVTPLDLRLVGENLDVRAPRYFLASSVTDADLRLRAGGLPGDGAGSTGDAFVLSGFLTASEAQLVGDRAAKDAPVEGETGGAGETGGESVGEEAGGENGFFERVLFDNVTVRAPQELRFTAGYGSAELGLDLTVSGSAAAPRLAGEARALRGSFGFANRDFTIDRAVASFDPTRGAYPALDVAAHTSFDKTAVLRGADARRVDFAEPSGNAFDVLLTLAGDLGGSSADTNLALAPQLESPARIEVPGEGGPRPLSDGELLSLLTVGRLELGSTLVGTEGVAGSVAGSAVDTAVDLFILSELQNAIGDALGLDFTIQTSPLSNVLNGDGDPFGVSLELGGYVDEDLFASYRIGSYSDPTGQYALSNEFSLSYDLAPLKLNLSGGLNFTEAFSPVPAFGIALGYDLAPFTFDAGVDLSGLEQRFGLGVSIRW